MVDRPSASLAATAVKWQATLHLHPRFRDLRDLQHSKDATWRAWTQSLINVAPQRTDMAIPYLTAAIDRGRYPEVTSFAEQILSRDRNDPVGLYFLGASLTGHPDRKIKIEGLKFIAESLEEGIERFMPVPAELERLARRAARL